MASLKKIYQAGPPFDFTLRKAQGKLRMNSALKSPCKKAVVRFIIGVFTVACSLNKVEGFGSA